MMDEEMITVVAPEVRTELITNTDRKERTVDDIFQEYAEFEQKREDLGIPEFSVKIPNRGTAKYDGGR